MPRQLPHSLLTGLISAGLFMLVAYLGLGFFFLFLPTLPLLYTGLSGKPQAAFQAGLVAALTVGIVTSAGVAMLYLLFLALPAWYMAKLTIISATGTKGARIWFPIGLAFLHLMLYALTLMAAAGLYYAGQEGGMAKMLSDHINQEFAHLGADFSMSMQMVAGQWAFLIFTMMNWLWALALYAHLWLAHRLLARANKQLRPGVGIEPFAMPNWLLSLLAIAALGSLIGSPSMQLVAKAAFLSLMLPYFLLGCALMHRASQAWPSRRFFLFFVYFMVIAQFWPALILSGMGVAHHIKALSGGPTSSKS